MSGIARRLFVVCAAFVAGGLVACQSTDARAPMALEAPTFVSGAILAGEACSTSETVRCHTPGPLSVDGREVCLVGERRCRDGAWSDCEDVIELVQGGHVGADGVSRAAFLGDALHCAGSCDPHCFVSRDAPDDGDLGDTRLVLNGVTWDATAGGLIIGGPSKGAGGRYAWVSSSGANVVNKLNLATQTNDGVYRTGRSTAISNPSRTTVDHRGFVYVANRNNASITKIAGDLGNCVETNGIPDIQTSQGETSPGVFDLLGANDQANRDECIIWDRTLDGGVGGPRGLAIDAKLRLWVGLRDSSRYYVLDTETGAILHGPIAVGHKPYGAAISPNGTLWSAATAGTIQSIDTNADNPTEANVGPLISNPVGGVYGIAVDGHDRVFVATGTNISRYDPASSAWLPGTTNSNARGLSTSAEGRVYVAGSSGDIITEHDVETLAILRSWTVAQTPRGVAPDFNNHLWAPNDDTPNCGVIDLATNVVTYVNTFGNNYIYSDFTGYGFLTYTIPSAEFTRAYDAYTGCGADTLSRRQALYYDTETPDTTAIYFFARSAATFDGLASAREVQIGTTPPALGYLDIAEAFEAELVDANLRYFQVRVSLHRNGSSESPVFRTMALEEYCAE